MDELRRLAFENHGTCTYCGYEFKESDTSHSGYGADEQPLYVCDSCSGQLKETAARTNFLPHPYEVPNCDTALWRYMNFTKYVSMLYTSSLYFSRADKLNDPFEGAKGYVKNKSKWDNHFLSFFAEVIKNPPDGTQSNLTKEQIKQQSQELFQQLEMLGKTSIKRVFVNCWHENKHESEAMWNLYSSNTGNAIAIKTTYCSLYESMGREPSIEIGRVKYIDFSKNFAGINNSFWRKRKSFEHEREVRAVIHDLECKKDHKLIPCDITTLIEEVRLSPVAPIWFLDIINDINTKYGFELEVIQSNLNEEPFF